MTRRSAQTSDLPIISDLLKPGQEILVQIAKEPIAKKGARITSHIALPGRFLVFMPTVSHAVSYTHLTLHTKYAGFHTKQIFWISAGLVVMFLFAKIDYHKLIDFVPWAYGVCLLALVAVLAVGHKAMGGRRWLKLGPMQFQPSEWVKLVLILAVARYFANLGGRSLTWKDIFKAFALVGVPMLLVLKQPDLGTTLTYTPILVAGLFLGGINVRQALILGACALALVGGIWSSGKLLKPYQKARLTSFINPDSDPRGSGYQIRQSLIAVGSGGVWGKGAAQGTQTQGDFLPIPHADFIFACLLYTSWAPGWASSRMG